MVGTQDKPPMWADAGLQPVIGTALDFKVAPTPLTERELCLLLTCWKRWDAKSVPGSASATWLTAVQSMSGPECEDWPFFRKADLDELEATRLLNDSGFQFLPDKELQECSSLEIVMSVGLRLCTLEFAPKQWQTLAYLSLVGMLPEFFPHHQWVEAVQWSFSTQEVATFSTLQEWKEALEVLQLIESANVSVVSVSGCTLWTRGMNPLPAIDPTDFPVKVMVTPEARCQDNMPEVLAIEETGL